MSPSPKLHEVFHDYILLQRYLASVAVTLNHMLMARHMLLSDHGAFVHVFRFVPDEHLLFLAPVMVLANISLIIAENCQDNPLKSSRRIGKTMLIMLTTISIMLKKITFLWKKHPGKSGSHAAQVNQCLSSHP